MNHKKQVKVPRCETSAAAEMVADTIEHYGLIQKEVACAMGISPAMLSGVVSGRKKVSAEFALRFERCLGLSAEWLLRTQSFHDYCTAYHDKAEQVSEVQSLLTV